MKSKRLLIVSTLGAAVIVAAQPAWAGTQTTIDPELLCGQAYLSSSLAICNARPDDPDRITCQMSVCIQLANCYHGGYLYGTEGGIVDVLNQLCSRLIPPPSGTISQPASGTSGTDHGFSTNTFMLK